MCLRHFFLLRGRKKQALDPANFRRCGFIVASNSESKWTIPEARQFPLYRRKPTCYILLTDRLFHGSQSGKQMGSRTASTASVATLHFQGRTYTPPCRRCNTLHFASKAVWCDKCRTPAPSKGTPYPLLDTEMRHNSTTICCT